MSCSTIPTLRHEGAVEMIEYLCDVYGFRKHLVVPGGEGFIAHAQLTIGDNVTELMASEHGGKLYSARDPEGHLWSFGSYDPFAPVD